MTPTPTPTPVTGVFTINPNPSDAKVVIDGEERTSVEVDLGTTVSWEVSKDGYETQSGTYTVTEDYTMDVTLEEETEPLGLAFNYSYDGTNSPRLYNSTNGNSGDETIFCVEGYFDLWVNHEFIATFDGSDEFVELGQYMTGGDNYVNIVPHENTMLARAYDSLNEDRYVKYITEIYGWSDNRWQTAANLLSWAVALTKVVPFSEGFHWSGCTRFANAFMYCTHLTELPAGMFDACAEFGVDFSYLLYHTTRLTSLPDKLFAGFQSIDRPYDVGAFDYALAECGVEELQKGLFDGTKDNGVLLNSVNLFAGCPDLVEVEAGLFDGLIVSKTGNYQILDKAFLECSGLKTVLNIFEGISLSEGCSIILGSIFRNCDNINSVNRLFGSNLGDSLTEVNGVFYGCSSIPALPSSLFEDNPKIKSFNSVFKGCTFMVGETPYAEIDDVKVHWYERENYPDLYTSPTGQEVFASTHLTDWDNIPDSWKVV